MYKLRRQMTGFGTLFPSCVNLAKSVKLKFFLSLPLLFHTRMYTCICPGVELGEGAGEQLTCQCPRSLSLKSAEAPVAAAVSVLIPLVLRCQLPRGSGIKPGPAKASQRRPGAGGVMRVCSRCGYRLELPPP